MKKVLCIALMATLLFNSIPFANAEQNTRTMEVWRFENGNYVVTTIVHAITRADYEIVSGRKTAYFYHNNGTELFSLTVHGTFHFDGENEARCTSASYSYSIAQGDWTLETASSTKSVNKAMAEGTFIRRLLGVTVDSKKLTVSIICDKNGNLS